MAKLVKRLTDLKVKSLKKIGSYPDGGGLYLQVSKTGAKSWFYRYQVNGKGRKKGLGPYTIITLEMARDAANGCQVLRQKGIDPIQYEQQQKIDAELKAGRAKPSNTVLRNISSLTKPSGQMKNIYTSGLRR